jgi:hypothetical protein
MKAFSPSSSLTASRSNHSRQSSRCTDAWLSRATARRLFSVRATNVS